MTRINYNVEAVQTIQNHFLTNNVKNIIAKDIVTHQSKQAMSSFHRNTVLKQGKANFDIASDGLSAIEKVDLYGYYYFQMHMTSLFVFYLTVENSLVDMMHNKQIHFVDVGCGPGTGGYAFNSIIERQSTLQPYYYGLDSSINMLEKGKSVLDSIPDNRFKTTFFSATFEDVRTQIEKVVESKKPQIIVLNFAFLFASDSLDVNTFVDSIKELTQKVGELTFEVVFLFQNPTYSNLNVKWEQFKARFPEFNTLDGFPRVLTYQYDDCLKSSHRTTLTLKAKTEILKK